MRLLTGEQISSYGFRWGVVDVARTWSRNGYRGLTVDTDRQYLDIVITPTGLIRVGEVVTKPNRERTP